MQSSEIRQKFLKFFEEKGHKIVPSSSLVPENDPTTLFTGSGMQPMLPYLLGEQHPLGTRLADSQKSFRSGDIEEVGDNRHTTFFEMLGNWSFGDYFKREQLTWIFQFLTDEIKIDPEKLYVTVFLGDDTYGFSKDTESIEVWKELFRSKGIEAKEVEIGSEADGYAKGMRGGRIFSYDAGKNWWSRAGVPGKMPVGEPGGPDSEMFYDFGTPHDPKFGPECHPNCDCGRFLEIGNSVFMEYLKKSENVFVPLEKKNVDFGGGLERITAASLHNPDVFAIDVFQKIFAEIKNRYGSDWDYGSVDEEKKKTLRIIADHLRSSVFLIADGVQPSNADRGYFVRRLLRRAIYKAYKLAPGFSNLYPLTEAITQFYKDAYPEVYAKTREIQETIELEEGRFGKTLVEGEKKAREMLSRGPLSGKDAFLLFSSYGFPFELSQEISSTLEVNVSDVIRMEEEFKAEFKEHQDISRAGSEQKFKGGLGDTSEMSLKYHTATHLLHQALHDVLGAEVMQKGSNITPERLRFDFSFPRKMTDEEKAKVEEIVNAKIKEALPVNKVVMPKAEAEKSGAYHFFGEKYPDEVNVYYIGDSLEQAYSKEFCGGPHVENISVLGTFKITKEEAVSAGVRRIKAVLV